MKTERISYVVEYVKDVDAGRVKTPDAKVCMKTVSEKTRTGYAVKWRIECGSRVTIA